jgi:hypothetical protein
MIKDFVNLLFSNLIIISLGWITASFFIQKKYFGERITLSIPLGFGIISFVLFMVYSLPFPLELQKIIFTIFLIFMTISIGKFIYFKRKECISCMTTHLKFKQFLRDGSIKYWIILLILFFVSLFFSIYFPTITPDGFVYDYIGKILASSKDMSSYYNEARPFRTPIAPLLHSYFYSFNIIYPRIIYPLFYLSILLFTYFKIKERTGGDHHYAMIFSLILATTPVFWWRSYLTLDNLIAACYFYFGVIYWYETLEGDKDGINKKYLLSGLCFSLAIWSRAEFIFFFIPAIIISVYINYKNDNLIKRIFYLCVFPVTVSLMWLAICLFITEWAILELKTYAVLITLVCFCLAVFYGNKYFKSAILLLLILVFTISKYSFNVSFDLILTELVNYISYFKFRFLLYFFLQGYWIFTVLLFLYIPIYWKGFNKSQKILSFFLISFYLSVILVMTSVHETMTYKLGEPRGYEAGIINAVKSLFFNPGNHINGSSQRTYLTMYPILVFLVAHSIYKIELKGIIFAKTYLTKIIVLGNILLLFIIFMQPRLKIILENPTIDHERILTTNQVKDINNSFQPFCEFAYKIKEMLPQDSIVLFSSNEARLFIAARNIIFPILSVSVEKPYKLEFSVLEPYKKHFKQFNLSNIYFASKKETFLSNISSIKSTVLYDDENWHILKLEM